MPPASGSTRVDAAELRALVAETFAAAGSERDEAALLADHLVEANLVGHDSHGVIRVAKYLDWLGDGKVLANRHARVVLDAGPLLCVDGDGGYGQVIAREAMDLGIERAGSLGVAVVGVRGCGHVGRVGAWAEMAVAAGLISVHFVNSSGFGILVAPHGGRDRRLSANPIAVGIPVPGRPPIILDMATSIIAEGKIQVARNKGESLPEGCVLDGSGRPTRDPQEFYRDPPGAILPFGGHKGSGLSIVCEVLAGSLTGGMSSHPHNPTADRLVNNMLTILLRPGHWVPEPSYAQDVSRLVDWVKASPPAEPGGSVLAPGDIERRTREERETQGIPLDAATWAQIGAAARAVGLPDERLAGL